MAKTALMTVAEAAVLLGMPEREITSTFDSPAGPVIDTFDGGHYIIVDGVIMALEPHDGYLGPLPIFAPDVEEDAAVRAVESEK